MKIKCEYCESMFDDTLENCPACGAPNKNVRRSTPDQPTTIDGLLQWYAAMGLPPEEVTRFFIGKNITDHLPKKVGFIIILVAYGILLIDIILSNISASKKKKAMDAEAAAGDEDALEKEGI